MTIAAATTPAVAGGWPAPRLSPGAAAALVVLRLRLAHGGSAAGDDAPATGAAPVSAVAASGGPPAADPARTDPDAELLRRVLGEYPHETRAFTALVQRHWGRVWSICQAILLDPDDAEDAAQVAFLKTHRYLPSWRGESRFVAWLARIARNAALDLLASRRREREARERLGEDPLLLRLWAPARAADPAGPFLDLRRALAGLDPPDRVVLVLHEIEGVSYEEIAEWLDDSPGAVRMRAMRARRRLRDALERAGARP